MEDDNIIKFRCSVEKVQTLTPNVGGGIRVTLDLPEYDIVTMAHLATVQAGKGILEVRAIGLINNQEQSAVSKKGRRLHAVETRTKRKPKGQTTDKPGTDSDTRESRKQDGT